MCILSITGTAASIRGLPDLVEKQRQLLWKAKAEKSENDIFQLDLDDSVHHPVDGPQRESDRSVGTAGLLDESLHHISRKKRKSEKRTWLNAPTLRARLAKPCSYCHVPYHHRLAPYNNMKLVPCLLCGRKWVPEVLLSTTEPPRRLPVRGPGELIQARVCRSRPKALGENDALAVSGKFCSTNNRDISTIRILHFYGQSYVSVANKCTHFLEALPFLEYELARQLMLKLKIVGRNAAFSLKSEVDVGSTLIGKRSFMFVSLSSYRTKSYFSR